jgi:hypothetical protein
VALKLLRNSNSPQKLNKNHHWSAKNLQTSFQRRWRLRGFGKARAQCFFRSATGARWIYGTVVMSSHVIVLGFKSEESHQQNNIWKWFAKYLNMPYDEVQLWNVCQRRTFHHSSNALIDLIDHKFCSSVENN